MKLLFDIEMSLPTIDPITLEVAILFIFPPR